MMGIEAHLNHPLVGDNITGVDEISLEDMTTISLFPTSPVLG